MTLQEIKDVYKEVFYIEDDTIIDLMVAIAVSVKTKSDAIWLLVIGPPSGGKTELVNIVSGVPYAHQVSTLTENAFLSGMAGDPAKEKSLLHRIGTNGLILMKDFTSILSLKEELRKKILGDMREIYEGHLSKVTGNGRSSEWKGKVNFIGAVTDAIYMNEGDDASMGRRTIDYIMPEFSQEVRIKMAKRASKNINDISEKREKIKQVFADFIMENQALIPQDLPDLPEDFIDEMIMIADFSTKMRTATKRNFHGELTFAPGNELPTRMNNQLMIIAQVLIWLNGGVLKPEHKALLIKVALDSISQQRRVTLRVLAAYDRCTTKGVAQEISYPTKTVLAWLEDINVVKGCARTLDGRTDVWTLNTDFKELMRKYDNVKYKGEYLKGDEGEDGGYYSAADDPMNFDPGTALEEERAVQREFDAM